METAEVNLQWFGLGMTSSITSFDFLFKQVALQWGMSRGASVIVKSFNPNRMRENMGALDLELDDQDLLQMDQLEERKIMRGEFLVNETTSPYRTIQDLWDGEI